MDTEEIARQAVVSAYRTQIDVVRRFRRTLDDLESTLDAALTMVAAGTPTTLAAIVNAPTPRETLTKELAELAHHSRATREAVVRLAQAEGRSLSDLARQWGVSRQYLWRLAQLVGDSDSKS